MPSLKQDSEFEALMRNKQSMERKYAEIDRKANQLQDSIIKSKNQAAIRASKEYSKIYDKINTRYNYQTLNSIGGYME